jgi:hypothetical protein
MSPPSPGPGEPAALDPAGGSSASAGEPPGASLRIRTFFEYLIGRRDAVLELAATPAALGVAAPLVLSAALARNYDQRLLLVQPWRLLGPFVASLATSGVLFGFVYGVATLAHIATPGIGRA